MKRHLIFASSSAVWLAIMFGIAFHAEGIEAGATIAAFTYVMPFGGAFCSFMVAYYP